MTRNNWYQLNDLEDLLRQHAARTAPVKTPERQESVRAADWTPAVDASESADAFVLEIELTGVDRDSIDVALKENTLVIQGERPVPEGTGRRYHRMERPRGHFLRRFELPENVEAAQIDAEFADGMLILTLPKHKNQPKTATKIPIR